MGFFFQFFHNFFKANNFTGDYLNIVKRKGVDDRLQEAFETSWSRVRTNPDFKTLASEINIPEMDPIKPAHMVEWVDFFRSDHTRFWYPNQGDFKTFPAILLTDTGTVFTKLN